MSRTRHWAWGAVFAALCSLAYARAPGVPHGGGFAHPASSSFSHSFAMRADHADRMTRSGVQRNAGRGYSAAQRSPSQRPAADRNPPPLRGGAGFATGPNVTAFNTYDPNLRHLAATSGYRGDMRGGMQYAGAITPVSAEGHGVPRPPVNAPVRTGSIRADVARYNEERGASRPGQRQSDDPRPPDGSPYRN